MNANLNILIVEDELLIAEMLKEMLLELKYNVVALARNYAMAVDHLKNNSTINFVIVDVNLSEEKTGIDVATQIKDKYKIPFIFLTSYSDKKTFTEALAVKPEAYLIKPFSKIDLFTTLEIIKSKRDDAGKSIVIKDGHLNVKLLYSCILWVKSENVYIEVKTTEKTHVLRNGLDKFLEELNDASFIRIHRSYVVNVNHVKAVNGQYVVVDSEKLPLSRKFREDLMSKFVL